MPIDVNGYNNTFSAFVQFAQERVNAGEKKAIANIEITPLGGRTIVASTTDGVGFVGNLFRSRWDEVANDNARKLFLNAVTRMFGGRSNIPESVWKAINLQDYGRGAPLTARRIMAVKAAVDAHLSAPPDKLDVQVLGRTVTPAVPQVRKPRLLPQPALQGGRGGRPDAEHAPARPRRPRPARRHDPEHARQPHRERPQDPPGSPRRNGIQARGLRRQRRRPHPRAPRDRPLERRQAPGRLLLRGRPRRQPRPVARHLGRGLPARVLPPQGLPEDDRGRPPQHPARHRRARRPAGCSSSAKATAATTTRSPRRTRRPA